MPPASAIAGTAPEAPPPQYAVAAAAIGIGAWLVLAIAPGNPRLAGLSAIGILCGLTLYHAAFGFASAYRRFIVLRDGAGIRAQLLMLALATLAFAPILSAGEVLGEEVAGAVAPAGVQVAIGAFLFGVGMQLGGGCGSGTLYTVGGGSTRMMITLVAFCAGGFWATHHVRAWESLPHLGEVALGETLGWPSAVALQLAAIAALYVVTRRVERRPDRSADPTPWQWHRLFGGPWPLLAGAVLLVAANVATLALSGYPWGITWAFTLWAAKLAQVIGWRPDPGGFWDRPFQRDALASPVLEDVTSVMDFGIVIGALLAAALAGRFAPTLRTPPKSLFAAIIGGLLMGYGARISFGCNIGAFFSGIASTSLHGWIWIAAALPGTWLGVRLRPRFGLAN